MKNLKYRRLKLIYTSKLALFQESCKKKLSLPTDFVHKKNPEIFPSSPQTKVFRTFRLELSNECSWQEYSLDTELQILNYIDIDIVFVLFFLFVFVLFFDFVKVQSFFKQLSNPIWATASYFDIVHLQNPMVVMLNVHS